MPEDADPDVAEPSMAPAAADVEAYATDDGGVVLYDSGNPLAWIETHTPIRLDDAV